MARETRRSGEKNDGQDLEMEKFIKDLSDNTVHTKNNLERKKMSKSFRQFKKGDFGLREAKANYNSLTEYLQVQTSG